MKNKKIKNLTYIILLIFGLTVISFGFLSDDKNGQKQIRPLSKLNNDGDYGKQGDAYRLNINNINMPMNRSGVIADVDIPPDGTVGKFKGSTGFLYSSGFFLSGYADGQLWTNAVASATLVEDYKTGRANPEPGDDAQMYVLSTRDVDFGTSWQDWIDAVALGADFYDGNGDGIYTPVDLNGNGVWDSSSVPGAMDGEDRPDLIGDETVWCLYHDGLPQAQRRWNTVPPYGIEIRQSAFAFASAGAIGNIIFIRYRFTYTGRGNPNEADKMTDVYFGVWADPDNGDHTNDVVGSDVPRNVGYTYDNQEDEQWGNQPPCFMIDFFSGPRAYIDGETYVDNDGSGDFSPGDAVLDTAYSVRGQVIGVEEFLGAKNMPVSSFVLYINGDPNLNDPANKEEARGYIEGRDKLGVIPDPCTFAYGGVFGGVDCTTVDPRFWFSGDPVPTPIPGVGWICTQNEDVRQMTNTGPFELNKNEQNEIVVAYVVGQGTTPLNSITVARAIDDGAQNIFDLNFLAPNPPPPVIPQLVAGDHFIDIIWDTPLQMNYTNTTPTWDLFFHSYEIYAFRTNSTADIVSGQANSVFLTRYQVSDSIKSVYQENGTTGGITLLYPEADAENKLDTAIYKYSELGRIRLRIVNDPFEEGPVVKGKPYYFAIVGTALNEPSLVNKDNPGAIYDSIYADYYLSSAGFVQEVENIRTIYSIILGEDVYNPPLLVQPANKISGQSFGNVGYDIIYNDSLTSEQYEVSFLKDSSVTQYRMFWSLTNLSTGVVNPDSSLRYTWGQTSIDEEIIDGFIPRVEEQLPAFGVATYTPAGNVWYDPFSALDATGVYYVADDIPQSSHIPTFPGQFGSVTTGDQLRNVKLRFGESGTGKAYRYINDYIGGFITRTNYTYGPAITAADTVGKGVIGNWDEVNDRPNGFVDVPFTAWIVDEVYGEEKQLAVGFVEKRNNPNAAINGNPDGNWDPSDSLIASGEIIIIFNADYDPTGSQIEYTGGDFTTPSGTETVWSDLLKAFANPPKVPEDALGISDEQKAIFESPWFNTLYVASFQKTDPDSFYRDGDVLDIPVDVYPYTDEDVYQFTTSGEPISEADQQDLWNKVNVFPNPLFGFNEYTGYESSGTPDDPWVTFSNLPPTDITIRIYSLSGTLVRTLTKDPSNIEMPFLRWDLQNDAGLRVGSGMFLAIVTSPQYGDKVLKLAIIMPQKQIQRF
ncbi:hypothetical protein ACFLSH_00655 [Bacteroidota bacterium]